jgi:aminocarboxymuconate-semialdehyde decarboxylase
MLIDVHAHILTEAFLCELAAEGAFGISRREDGSYLMPGYGPLDRWLFDLEARLDGLRRRDVSLQIVAPPPRLVSAAGWAVDAEMARRLNAQTADAVAAADGRLVGLAVPPLAEPDRAADEVRRALGEHGLQGVALPSSAGGRPLDGPDFAPLFDLCAAHGLFVFMHPTTGIERPALQDYTMLQLVGWPFETTLAVARLIFAGLFERHPEFNLVLAHGGGALPFLAGRLDLGYLAPDYEANPACRAHISKPPSAYLKQIFFDTVVASGAALRYLVGLVGAERVMFGSDYPFEIGDAEGETSLAVIGTLPKAEQQLIRAGNAEATLASVALP